MDRRPHVGLDNQAFRGRLRDSRTSFLQTQLRSTARAGQSIDGLRPERVKSVQKTAPQLPSVQESKPAPHKKLVANSPVTSEKPHHRQPTTYESKPHMPKQSRSSVLRRQGIKSEVKDYRAHKHRRPLVPTLLTSLAVMLFVFGLVVIFSTIRTNHTVKAQVKQLSAQSNKEDGVAGETPSEDDPPSDTGSYKVAPDLPRIMTIEKIGVNTRVRRVGVGPNNILKAPANIFDAGWYDGSAKPGENGTVVIDGHVSGPTKRGVFYSIGTLKAGDKVKLERGDGKVFSYTVTGTQVYDNNKVDMAKVMTSSVPGKPALNFMTCTGRFNVRTNQFEQRVVVFTVQD